MQDSYCRPISDVRKWLNSSLRSLERTRSGLPEVFVVVKDACMWNLQLETCEVFVCQFSWNDCFLQWELPILLAWLMDMSLSLWATPDHSKKAAHSHQLCGHVALQARFFTRETHRLLMLSIYSCQPVASLPCHLLFGDFLVSSLFSMIICNWSACSYRNLSL
jgi:hypothetical protein